MLKHLLLVTVLLQGYASARNLGEVREVTGRVELGGRNYYFETNVQTNVYNSSEICYDRGLVLVSIQTEEENNLIAAHLQTLGEGRLYWTSGNDMINPAYFVWKTGERVTYWPPGKSEHAFGSQGYIYVAESGHWDVAYSHFLRYAACEEL